MKGGQQRARVFCAAIFLTFGGCAIGGGSQTTPLSAPVVERDLLAEAASQVEEAKWPKPEPAPLFSWITGDRGSDRVSKSEAVAFYVESLMPEPARFEALNIDVSNKIVQASYLHQLAMQTVEAPRVSMNDIAVVEQAIQTLREHRDIYVDAAKELNDAGEDIDSDEVKSIRQAFNDIISELADAADSLADRMDEDHSSTYAAPTPAIAAHFSDL